MAAGPVRPEGGGGAAGNISALKSAENADIYNNADIRISWYHRRCRTYVYPDITGHIRPDVCRDVREVPDITSGKNRGKTNISCDITEKNCDITAQNSDITWGKKGSA